jgi:hypothetical protein
VAYEKKRKIMRNVASVAELKKSFFRRDRQVLTYAQIGQGEVSLHLRKCKPGLSKPECPNEPFDSE